GRLRQRGPTASGQIVHANDALVAGICNVNRAESIERYGGRILRELTDSGSEACGSDGPVGAVHIVEADQAGVAGIHHVDLARSIDTDGIRIVELPIAASVRAKRGPVRALEIIDANDAGVVSISDINTAGRIYGNAKSAVKLPHAAALRTVRRQVRAVQIVGAYQLAGIRKIQRRVRRVKCGGPVADLAGCWRNLVGFAINGLRDAIQSQSGEKRALECVDTGHVGSAT